MSELTDLSIKMRSRADTNNLPAEHPLRLHADKFDKAAAGYYSSEPTVTVKSFMGAWARARRAWSDYTGEDLI